MTLHCRAFAATLMAVAIVPGAMAATVSVDVRGADGKPMAGAVVLIDTPHTPDGPVKFDYKYEMAQQNITFVPHVVIVPVGATVTFPNRDTVRHHVYSFSRAKKFDLKLYGRDETRSVTFDKAGVVALGCNIHDTMSGFVVVTDTPFAAQTDATGRATVSGVPAGLARIRLWHPAMRASEGMQTQGVTIPASGLSASYTIRGR